MTQEKKDADTEAGREAGTAVEPRILVVDDVPDNREVLTRRLIRRGFNVDEAGGGIEALQKISEHEYALVLLDIMMPDLSGTEVLKTVRETQTPDELPIIMVTAKSQSQDVVECLDGGANDYVTKPVDFAVALARIKTQVSRWESHREKTMASKSLAEEAARLDKIATTSTAQLEKASIELKQETQLRERSEQELHYLAYHDTLTGLLNRTAFEDALTTAFAQRQTNKLDVSLMFIDLDGFKSVNDLYGHKVGDQLLIAVSERLKFVLGDDAQLARIGGDEFGAVLVDAHDVIALGEDIVEALAQPFTVEMIEVTIGASCGVAHANSGAEDLDTLMKAADLAMYHGKSSGKSRVVLFEPFMMERNDERQELERDLKVAVQKGDFDIFFQPLIDTQSKKVSCFEALIRWYHPTRGMISPDVFIPIAEECGLIVHIGQWVLRQACEEATHWPEDISVAVNLSPVQLRHSSLLSTVISALSSSQLPPHRLELEVTESILFESAEANANTIKSLRDLGVRVSLDDFGTGYSSLSYLQSFKFDKIKIDKTFVQELASETENAFIVKAILSLGASIGVTTTAEGIELESQLAFITKYGCTQAQGYLFSRPLSASDARIYISKSSDGATIAA